MYYPASCTIAEKHPELTDQIQVVDRFFYECDGGFRIGPAADLLGVDPNLFRRLVQLYIAEGTIKASEVYICPEDGEVLEPDESGSLACDVCEGQYQPEECERETIYRVVEARRTTRIQPPLPFPQGCALLVGIATYHRLRPLSKTATDARDLHDLLAQSGYSADNLALLLDEQATKSAISDKLDHLARRAGPDDTVLIFFSGHGAQRIGGFEPGEYLCPVGADWHNLRATAISDEEFTTALQAIRAGRVAVFLDACHSGGVGEAKDAAFQLRAGLSEAAYARLAVGRGRVVVASCRPDEVSWELAEMRNGLFTHYLLEGLRGAAAGADGAVHIFDLFDYVSRQMPLHKPQHPLFKSEIELNFAITIGTRPPAVPAPPAPAPIEATAPSPLVIDPDGVDPTRLRQAMHSAYDRPAFEILCKDLGLDYHDLRGETLETKMLYLIDWHQRRRRYAQLVRKVLEDHPYLAQELQ